MEFKTVMADTYDGKASFCIISVWDAERAKWKHLDTTSNFRAYPRMVRARDAAIGICKRYAKQHGIDPTTVSIQKI